MSRCSTSEFIQAMTVSVSCLCPRLASRASTRRAAADNALSSTTFALGQQAALEAGYNVVAPGYALAPQNPYPVPTVQLSQAVEFLKEHGAEYGIDMNRLVIEGGSAGGYIAAQYALIQSNPDYAARTGIEQTIDPDALQAVVLDSAPLDTEDLATEAPSLSDDFVFDFAARAFLGTTPSTLEEAQIIDNVTSAYPPTFIDDGNIGTWPHQAQRLSDRLDELGVPTQLYLVPRSEADLPHAYVGGDLEPWVGRYNEQKLRFLAEFVR